MLLKFDNYPDSCPPKEAVNFEGVFYRLCKGEELCREDFITHFESGSRFPDHKLCEAMALSFFDSYDHAENIKNRYRKFKKYTIKPVEIVKEYGIGILEKQNGHLNLWEYRNIDIFAELSKGGESKDEYSND